MTGGEESGALVSRAFASSWALWLMQQSQGKAASWTASQTKVAEVSSVESFWRLLNHIHAPSRLSHADYSFFRQGVTPAWEDPLCKDGGRWVAKAVGDDAWIQLLSALVTCEFPDAVGAVFSARRGGTKLALWLSTSEEFRVLAAGRSFKLLCEQSLAPDVQLLLTFESFAHTGETSLKL
jgi:hypothetical protein